MKKAAKEEKKEEEKKEEKKRVVGKPFVKGDPRCGRPRLPEELKGVKKITKWKFVECANKFLYMTRDQITAALENPNAPMLDLMIGGIIAKAVKDSDTVRANFILDRLVSRLKLQEDVDRMLDVTPVGSDGNVEKVPYYVVKINRQGRFLESRPSEVEDTELEKKASNE